MVSVTSVILKSLWNVTLNPVMKNYRVNFCPFMHMEGEHNGNFKSREFVEDLR